MHASTPELAAALRRADDLAAQLDLLSGAYEGERCVIVTCGPSLGDVPPEQFRRALEGQLTLSVKQAIDVTAEQTDFLCFNSFNVTRYRTPAPDTISCLVRESTGRTPQLNRADLVFTLSEEAGDLDRALASTRRFADHPLDTATPRPWGPGIMYELVLYLAVHLGVAEIVTVGWDIANTAGRNTHFYDTQLAPDGFDKDRGEAFSASEVRRALPPVAKTAARWLRAGIAHSRGTLYNKAVPVPGETERVSASTTDANRWLADEGIRLRVVTESPHLAPEIERLSVDQALDLLATT
jgi:hypothetical protein